MKKGIDSSKHQGIINWNKVKKVRKQGDEINDFNIFYIVFYFGYYFSFINTYSSRIKVHERLGIKGGT